MNEEGCVTIECSVILVRLHSEPGKFGEFPPYSDAFTLIQTAPGIFEAKVARGLMLTPSQRRSLGQQLWAIGGRKVFYERHKPGKEPYTKWIDLQELLE